MPTYNGFANYETWAVSLWLGNDEGSYEYWREQAREAWTDSVQFAPQALEGGSPLTVSQDARIRLSDALEDWAENEAPDLGASVWADLLAAAIGEVDWAEIADHMLSDIEGYEATA